MTRSISRRLAGSLLPARTRLSQIPTRLDPDAAKSASLRKVMTATLRARKYGSTTCVGRH